MSNGQLTGLTLALLFAHLAALAVFCLRRRDVRPMRVLNAAAAGCVLAYLAAHPKAFSNGVDWTLVALAVFEALVLAAAVLDRRLAFARAMSWVGFAAHLTASLGAVAFTLLFKIDRLI